MSEFYVILFDFIVKRFTTNAKYFNCLGLVILNAPNNIDNVILFNSLSNLVDGLPFRSHDSNVVKVV